MLPLRGELRCRRWPPRAMMTRVRDHCSPAPRRTDRMRRGTISSHQREGAWCCVSWRVLVHCDDKAGNNARGMQADKMMMGLLRLKWRRGCRQDQYLQRTLTNSRWDWGRAFRWGSSARGLWYFFFFPVHHCHCHLASSLPAVSWGCVKFCRLQL